MRSRKGKLLFAAGLCAIAALVAMLAALQFEIQLEPTANGNLYSSVTRVHLFASAEICFEPAPGDAAYQLTSVTVNGKDRTQDVRFNRLKLRGIVRDQQVCAVFSPVGDAPVSANPAVFVAVCPQKNGFANAAKSSL